MVLERLPGCTVSCHLPRRIVLGSRQCPGGRDSRGPATAIAIVPSCRRLPLATVVAPARVGFQSGKPYLLIMSSDGHLGCLIINRTPIFMMFCTSRARFKLYELATLTNPHPNSRPLGPRGHPAPVVTRPVSTGRVIRGAACNDPRQDKMPKEYSVSFRSKAVGMVHGGMSPKRVCEHLSIGRSQLFIWMKREKLGQGLSNKPGRGRRPSIHPVAKRVIAMATGKRHQSTRKLSQRLTRHGYRISRSTVHRYLRENLGVKPFKLSRRPKLTERQQEHRLRFAKERKNWSAEDWRRVLWSDESAFELYHPPNRHNDRVWAASTSEVPTVSTVKHPTKVHVWGMMSHRAVSQLHVVPQKTVINGEYYRYLTVLYLTDTVHSSQ